jgi:hypothetical protein
MRGFNSLTAFVTLFAGALMCTAAENEHARVPVLLELFTSEGCSSCPPADRLLEVLDQKQPVAGADLIVLSEHVDYWDRLGWRDPFSSSQYTARQQEYTNRFNLDGVYTPQLVVDGRSGVVGSDGRAVTSAIQKAIRERKIPIAIPDISHNGNQVTAHIEILPSDRKNGDGQSVLYVAIADNGAESHVTRGENAGRSLTHVAVTRVLRQVGKIDPGSASARDITLTAPSGAKANALRLIAFLQDPGSGRVLGVAEQKFQ